MDVDYGEGHWKCASCQRVRPISDLARMYVHDEFFMLCHGFADEAPTCYDRYEAGRARERARRGKAVEGV